MQRMAGIERGSEPAGEQVARTVQHVGEQLAGNLLDRSSVDGGIGEVVPDDALSLMDDALDDDRLGSHLDQRVHVALDERLVDILPFIGDAREDGCLGEVGGEDVRTVHEVRHGLAQLIGVGGVFDAAVSHDGVDDAERLRVLAIEALDDRHLLRGAQEARVDAVELDALLLPGVEVFAEHVGGVMHVEHGEFGVG